MKHYILVGFIGVLPCIAQAQWLPQSSETSAFLWSVDFVDDDLGNIVFGDTLLQTSDGGLNWVPTQVNITSSLTGVDFLDQDTGFAVGADALGNSIILKTTNGGASWTDTSPGVGTFMTGVFFHNQRFGWAFGQDGYPGNGVIVATTNGGMIWTEQALPPVSYLLSGFFVDSLTGWAVGDKVILKTTDGGSVWVEQDTQYTHSFSAVTLRSAFFANKDIGWVVGGISWVSVIAKTTDGGATWTHQVFQPPNPELDIGRLSSVYFVDDTTGWIVGRTFPGTTELILKSTDGGTSFVRQDDGIGCQLFSVFFVGSKKGWAVGECGTILATNNGGTSFVGLPHVTPNEFALYQNYPNPFNAETLITFELPQRSHVRLSVYDILGRSVITLVDKTMEAGFHRASLSATNLSSGVYHILLMSTDFYNPLQIGTRTRKATIVK